MLELVEGCIGIDLDQDHSEVIQTPDNIKQKRKNSESVNKSKAKTSKSNANKASATVTKSKKKKEPKINQKYDNVSSQLTTAYAMCMVHYIDFYRFTVIFDHVILFLFLF